MALRRPAIAASLLFLAAPLAALAGSTPIVTQRDSGKTLPMRLGDRMLIRLASGYSWVGPRLDGHSVRLTRVDFIRDPGYLEWQVSTRMRGTTRVSATGYRDGKTQGCDPGPCTPRLFRVTFVVR